MENKPVILITGSSGFIGSALARRLSPHYYIVGLDAKKPDYDPAGMSLYEVDVTSSSDIEKTLAEISGQFGPRIISVIHLIAYYSFDGEEDERYDTITYEGTRSLLENLKKFFTVEQFIFSSSMLVYKPTQPGEKITEESPVQESWAYPNSKLKVEEMLRREHADIPILNLRIAGVYDDTGHQPTLAHQILRIYEGWLTSVPFPGNPDHGQAMLHLEDLATAIQLSMEKRNQFSDFETLALAEEDVMSFRELQQEIGCQIHKRPWPVVRIPAFVAKTGSQVMEYLPFMRVPFIKPWMIPHSDEHFELDVSKVRRKLGWEPQFHLKNILPSIIELLKKDPKKWYSINKMDAPLYRDLSLINSEREKIQWLALVSVIFAGIWMLFTPFSFTHGSSQLEIISESMSGIFLIIFGALSLVPTLRWLRWINATIGVWLMFSPLAFSSPEASSYVNDTLVGFIVTVLSVYTPSPIKDQNKFGIPSGWTYNPSTAGQRLPIMFLGYLGFIFSRYLASYQLGHIPEVWDPFFGDGTARVLTSDVSKAFPVSDAGLGAFTYLLDVVAATIGGRYRWRTMPWTVILFGFMIVPAGATSIVLIMLQPISVGAWCSACLLTAFIMLLMVPPAIDEVVASAQFLYNEKQKGRSFWKTFWLGNHEEIEEVMPAVERPKGSTGHLVVLSLIGAWLMFAPALLNFAPDASNSVYIIAALVMTFSIIAFSEVARISRFLNIPIGVWLLGMVFLENSSPEVQLNGIVCGVLIILLSIPRGRKQEKFGTIDGIIHWTPLQR